MIPFRGGSHPGLRHVLSAHVTPTHAVRWMGNLRIHVDLPVGLACDIKPAELALVIFGVGTSQDHLTARVTRRISEKQYPNL